jgi:hypothetical protein
MTDHAVAHAGLRRARPNIDSNTKGEMMNNVLATIERPPKLDAPTRRAMLACGLWMRLGFIGASLVAVGVIQLFDGETSALSALSFVAGGAVLAALGWRRAHAALASLGQVDAPVISRAGAPPSNRIRTAVGA